MLHEEISPGQITAAHTHVASILYKEAATLTYAKRLQKGGTIARVEHEPWKWRIFYVERSSCHWGFQRTVDIAMSRSDAVSYTYCTNHGEQAYNGIRWDL